MSPNLLAMYVALSAHSAVLHSVRAKNGTLVTLQDHAVEPQLTKGQTFGIFVPTETEQAFIDLVTPKVTVRVDPMVNRLKKSEVERPVQFVLRVVRENPDLDRKGLIALCIAQGVADYTARTQVQVGLKRRKAVQALAEQVKAEQEEPTQDEGSTEDEQSDEDTTSQEG